MRKNTNGLTRSRCGRFRIGTFESTFSTDWRLSESSAVVEAEDDVAIFFSSFVVCCSSPSIPCRRLVPFVSKCPVDIGVEPNGLKGRYNRGSAETEEKNGNSEEKERKGENESESPVKYENGNSNLSRHSAAVCGGIV